MLFDLTDSEKVKTLHIIQVEENVGRIIDIIENRLL